MLHDEGHESVNLEFPSVRTPLKRHPPNDKYCSLFKDNHLMP